MSAGALAAFEGACADEMMRRASSASAWSPLTDPKTLEAWLTDAGETEVDDAGTTRISSWVGQVAGEVFTQGVMGNRPDRETVVDGKPVNTSTGGDWMEVAWSTLTPAQGDALIVIGQLTSGSGATFVLFDGYTLRVGVRSSGLVLAYFCGGTIRTGTASPTSPFAAVLNPDGASSYLRVDDLGTNNPAGDSGTGFFQDGITMGIHQNRSTNGWQGWWSDALLVRAPDDAYFTNYVGWASARWPSLSLTAPP